MLKWIFHEAALCCSDRVSGHPEGVEMTVTGHPVATKSHGPAHAGSIRPCQRDHKDTSKTLSKISGSHMVTATMLRLKEGL